MSGDPTAVVAARIHESHLWSRCKQLHHDLHGIFDPGAPGSH